ncbi:hypothetical protein MF4642_07870 [Acinetobacter sp. MF4642]|uniref:hypothetical protein n=1 Tax=Acinetobacter sp. MF4642 TaxID=1960825 RepID=UPI000995AE3A|nr:hypothetical protein [Acinetobacter sp. MF4642]OOW10256.1 hypothetical protein MF4642_07870 [Acinetobacter sp. MF4642]
MNLVERLGGYEAAKAEGEKWGFDDFLNNQLLEYRRQHNIFEVGDKVVSTLNGDDFWMNIICVIDGFHKSMIITKGGGHVIHHYDFRHATDEEIKAGKRLGVK